VLLLGHLAYAECNPITTGVDPNRLCNWADNPEQIPPIDYCATGNDGWLDGSHWEGYQATNGNANSVEMKTGSTYVAYADDTYGTNHGGTALYVGIANPAPCASGNSPYSFVQIGQLASAAYTYAQTMPFYEYFNCTYGVSPPVVFPNFSLGTGGHAFEIVPSAEYAYDLKIDNTVFLHNYYEPNIIYNQEVYDAEIHATDDQNVGGSGDPVHVYGELYNTWGGSWRTPNGGKFLGANVLNNTVPSAYWQYINGVSQSEWYGWDTACPS
jgi:hypothetical protein